MAKMGKFAPVCESRTRRRIGRKWDGNPPSDSLAGIKRVAVNSLPAELQRTATPTAQALSPVGYQKGQVHLNERI